MNQVDTVSWMIMCLAKATHPFESLEMNALENRWNNLLGNL